ncbi:MAG: D-alanine--D-alanine ligase family protein [bacterium JZ-2024 1]
MRVGITFNLKSDYSEPPGAPEDWLEEFDEESTIDAIRKALVSMGFQTVLIGGGKGVVSFFLKRKVDWVFNIAEGQGSLARESHIPALCELMGIPYTFAPPQTLALCLHKYHTKLVLKSMGIPVPRGFLCLRGEVPPMPPLPFPLIVKPCAEGSSKGLRPHSVCWDRSELEREVRRVWENYHQPVLVEEFVSGREFTVAVLGNKSNAQVLGWMEILPRNRDATLFVYNLECKRNWRTQVEYVYFPSLSRREETLLKRYALRAYQITGCRDAARLDFRLDSQGIFRLLEVNPLPGLNPEHSDLPMIALSRGMDFPQLIGRIVYEALQRYPELARFTLRNPV